METPADTYTAQHRGGKGLIGMTTKEEDFIEKVVVANSHSYILFFTNNGKVYMRKVYQIPEASRTAKGTNLVNLIEMESGERVTAMIEVPSFAEEGYLTMVTKCGIIKRGSHAVLFGQSEGVENVAREKCAQEDVALTITAQEKLERISSSLDGQEFKYRGRGPYHLRLLGEYQLLNALTVIDVCNALRSRGWDKLTDEAIDEGLSHAQWPGRLELLRRGPDFIVDGAHNPQCVDALMDSLAALYGDKKLIFLTGVLRDKDWHQMLRRALPLAKAFVVITPPSARALDENELAAWLNAQGVQAVPAKDTDDGVRRALALAGEDDAICSWGSLYFTGEVRRVLTEQ